MQRMITIVTALVLLPASGGGETMKDVYDVQAFGAAADGQTDDTAAIQRALDTAGQRGGTVYLPAGQYLIGGSLTVPTGVVLQGSWAMAHHGIWDRNTLLLATRGHGSEDGPALIEMQASTAVRGISVYYPNQRPDAIVPYPWTIHGQGMHNTIENVTLINSYNGIAIGPEWNELHLIRNVFGCPLRRGVLVDYCTDIGRLENVHFNIHYWHRANYPGGPKGEGPTEPYRMWVQEHLVAFTFGRTDWESLKDTFTYGAHTGYLFTDFGRGQMNGSLLGCGADGCIYGVRVERVQPMGLVITNGQFAAFRHPEMPKHDDDPPICGIYTTETFSGNLSLVNCAFWAGNAVAHLNGGAAAEVRFTECHFRDWAVYRPERPAIFVDGPTLQLRGCSFATPGKALEIGPKTTTAVVTENVSVGALDVTRPATGAIVLDRNVSR